MAPERDRAARALREAMLADAKRQPAVEEHRGMHAQADFTEPVAQGVAGGHAVLRRHHRRLAADRSEAEHDVVERAKQPVGVRELAAHEAICQIVDPHATTATNAAGARWCGLATSHAGSARRWKSRSTAVRDIGSPIRSPIGSIDQHLGEITDVNVLRELADDGA
jgi:hypothetical protein